MTEFTCVKCGERTTASVSRCQQCGGSMTAPLTKGNFLLLFGLVVVGFCGFIYYQLELKQPEPVPTKAVSSLKEEVAFQRVVAVLGGLKSGLSDPDTVKWRGVSSNVDATVICVEYSAKNSFGAYVDKLLVVANGGVSEKPRDWNKHCIGDGFINMQHAVYAL